MPAPGETTGRASALLPDPAGRWPVACAILAGLSVLFYARFLFTGRIFLLRDLLLDFYPMLAFYKEYLLQGELPYWNPYTGLGEPYFSNIQAALLYPFNLIHLLLPIPVSVSITVALHVVLAGVGTWMTCRALRISGHGSLLAAIAFSFGTLMQTRIEFYPSLCSYGWYPVSVALYAHWLRDRRPWTIVAGAAALSLQVYAGYPESLYFSFATLAVLAGTAGWMHRASGWRAMAGPGLALGVMTTIAILFAMVQILPVRSVLPETVRGWASESMEHVAAGSVNPAMLWASLFPYLYGTQGYYGRYWAPAVYEFWAGTFYIGVLPVMLCLAASVCFFRDRRLGMGEIGTLPPHLVPAVRLRLPFLLALLVLSLLYAMGQYTPFYQIIWQLVPPIRMFRWPSKALLCTTFALACLAGIALDRLLLGRRPGEGRTCSWADRASEFAPAVFSLSLAGFVLACLAKESQMGKAILRGLFNLGTVPEFFAHRIPWELLGRDAVKFAVVAVLSAVLLLALRRPAWQRVALFAAPLVLFLDLMLTTFPLLPSSGMDLFRNQGTYLARIGTGPRAPRFFRQDAQQMMYGTKNEELVRLSRDSLAASWPLVDKAYGVRGTGTFRLADMTSLLASLGEPSIPEERKIFLLKLMHCANGVSASLQPEYFFEGASPQIPQILSFGEPYPRAFVVRRVRTFPSWKAMVAALLTETFDPLAEALAVEGEIDDPDLDKISGRVLHRIDRITEGMNRLTVEVASSDKGLLVVADTHYKGWLATVNGKPAPIHEVNGAFRGVVIPAGNSVVDFTYRVPGLAVGAAITLSSLALAGGFLVWRVRRRARDAEGLTGEGRS